MEKEFVYVFHCEEVWDGNEYQSTLEVFQTKESAIKYMHDFLHDGPHPIVLSVKNQGWEVDEDIPTSYEASLIGYYSSNHINCKITKCEVK